MAPEEDDLSEARLLADVAEKYPLIRQALEEEARGLEILRKAEQAGDISSGMAEYLESTRRVSELYERDRRLAIAETLRKAQAFLRRSL